MRSTLLAMLALVATGSAAATAAPPVTITLAEFLPRDDALERRLLDEFERRNPGVRVAVKALPAGTDTQHQQFVTWLAAHDPSVDVLQIDVVWPAEFAAAGWIRPLDDRFRPAERAAFLTGPIEAVTYQGQVFAVPRFTEAGMLYYRTDLVAAAPPTWAALLEQARALARPDLAGYVFQGQQYEGLTVNVLELAWAHGGALLENGRVAIEGRGAVAGLALLADALRSGATPRGTLTYAEPGSLKEFTDGRALFHRNWAYAVVLAAAPESKVRDRFAVAPLPRGTRDGEPAGALGGWNLAVSRFSQRPDLAFRLVEYLTGEEVQRVKAIEEGRLPTRRALYGDPAVLARQPHMATVRPVIERARPRPAHPLYPAMSGIVAAYASRALTGAMPPARALEAAAAELRRLPGLE